MTGHKTNNPLHAVILLLVLSLMTSGCTERMNDAQPDNVKQEASAPITDQWVGMWYGPEGTFINIDGSKGQYDITIQNLDGSRTFQGMTVGNQIAFERDGVKAHIRATDGTETGMKWLLEKSHCLTAQTGEGYCRD